MKRVSATVSGRVQGVTYRASTQKKARKLGLVGWVRNLDNGDVEFVAEGSEEQLQKLVAWCNKGPLLARVDELDAAWGEATNEFSAFEVLR